MIAGISGIGAPGIITPITSASLEGINAVDMVARRNRDNNSLNGNSLEQNTPQLDRFTPMGAENALTVPGTAYGLSANQLRSRGMARQWENPLNNNNAGNTENAAGNPQSPTADADSGENTAETEVAAEEASAETLGEPTRPDGKPLSDDEKQQVRELEARDTEVRTHEQAHIAASGGYAQGSPHYDYQQGPDGRKYAIGGSVKIDTSEESTPEATIAKMEKVRAAAMAPAEPSSQDRAVAAEANQKINAARQEIVTAEESAPQAAAERTVTDDDVEARAGESLAAETVGNEAARRQFAQGLPKIPPADAGDSENSAKPAAASRVSAPVARLSYQQQRAMRAYGAA